MTITSPVDQFNLEYNTLSNDEIINMRVEELSRKGFCFLWILNSQLDFAQKCMQKWGYDVVDQIIWIKTRGGKMTISHGYYFLHSYEMCLVGYKSPPGECVEFVPRVSNNVILADVRGKSEKPRQIYEIVELMMPGAKKIELFARNNNLRHGWFALGNELGECYSKSEQDVVCDSCKHLVAPMAVRYKSKHKANYDLCERCFATTHPAESEFFRVVNLRGKEQLHSYRECDGCHMNPIRGLRFSCSGCEDYDLCENCYDRMLAEGPTAHIFRHVFTALDFPLPFSGFEAHEEYRCFYCSQKPILGTCIVCSGCKNLAMCNTDCVRDYVGQHCFFAHGGENVRAKNHHPSHNWEILLKANKTRPTEVKCRGCGTSKVGNYYKCNQCQNHHYCEACYQAQVHMQAIPGTSHREYHTYTMVNCA